ncbi:MAG: ABC transporter permease [Candidatus Marinimicrobia bacterium]|nr:ABC transporter permease [Candidatus Neomarinimicrobiota bacterium]|tara:strand:- start:5036 stop:6199 length:1164 start_codon:yes stop_codon:yes gene_type:complete
MINAIDKTLASLIKRNISGYLPVLMALIVIWVYFGISEPAFLSSRNLYYLLMQSSVVGILAIGITLILLLGEIDLSIAAVAGVAASILGVLSTNYDFSPLTSCLVALIAGGVLSCLMGLVTSLFGVPSFIATLAGLMGFQGLMMKILGSNGTINVRDPFIRGITTSTLSDNHAIILSIFIILIYGFLLYFDHNKRIKYGLNINPLKLILSKFSFFSLSILSVAIALNSYRGVPFLVVIIFFLTVFIAWFTKSTAFGLYIYAIGGNAKSARHVGIPVIFVTICTFTITGLIAAIAGIIGVSRYASVSYNTFVGGPLLLETIGAAVIGGTSLFGGHGSVWHALLGALVIGSLGNGLDLTGASAADKLIVSGSILLVAVSIDSFARRFKK